MPDPLILVPLVSLILPGVLAFGLVRALRSVWPAVILGLGALGLGVFFLSQASGARWDDGAALNQMFAAFGIALPAMISAAVGGTFAHRARRR